MPMWRGEHTIHFLIENTSWGLALGIATELIGLHPHRHFLQLFADCTYGFWGDDLDVAPAHVRLFSRKSCFVKKLILTHFLVKSPCLCC
jgi:hypothetical protein